MNLLARADAELVIAGQLDRTDMEAHYCIARQRWLRYLEMPAEEGALELRSALAGFERVYRPGATIVPPLVREYLECLGYQPPAGMMSSRGPTRSACWPGKCAWEHARPDGRCCEHGVDSPVLGLLRRKSGCAPHSWPAGLGIRTR